MARCRKLAYVCSACGSDSPVLKLICRVPADEATCSHCGGEVIKAFVEGVTTGIRGKEYFHPLHSDSLAINPIQVAEHRALFPNIKIDGEGRPIFENFRQHNDYLETCGFHKQDQRIKPKGRRIDKPKQPSSEAYPKEIK